MEIVNNNMDECYRFYKTFLNTELYFPPTYHAINIITAEQDRLEMERQYANHPLRHDTPVSRSFDIIFIVPQNMVGNFMGANANNDTLNNFLTSLLSSFRISNPQDVPLPMTHEALQQLPEKQYCELSCPVAGEVCSICQESYEPTSIVKLLPCNHYFHKDCIEQWLSNYHHKCPICRMPCGEHTAILDDESM